MLLDLAGGLFDQPDDLRSRRRMAAVDALNRRSGRRTVGFGTPARDDDGRCGVTTSATWDELLRV